MKTDIKDKDDGLVFPILMEAAPTAFERNMPHFVVLFSESGKGVVVYSSDKAKTPIGHYSEDWDMYCFTVFKKTLALQND